MLEHDEELGELKSEVAQLREEWVEVAEEYERARDAYAVASRAWRSATAGHDAASDAYRSAAEEFEHAQERWVLVRELVLVAAALDGANLGRFRAVGLRGVEQRDLRSCVNTSTRAYRHRLEGAGENLAGLDIDHIVPRSLGGADHPLNYQPLSSSVNRSIGNTWNIAKCLSVGVTRCAAAIAISMRCGSYRLGGR